MMQDTAKMEDGDDDNIISGQALDSRIAYIREHVARPIPQQPFDDSTPALVPFSIDHGGIIVGSHRHAANIPLLKSMGVVAVMNCASGGIARLPVDELKECGIRYAFTNVRQDSFTYPILHHNHNKTTGRRLSAESLDMNIDENIPEESLVCSDHLSVSNLLFADVRRNHSQRNERTKRDGNVLFFCVAGQNRSACLAIATLMLHGMPLEEIIPHLSRQRPFVLENVGFQQQIVELEYVLSKINARDEKVRELSRSRFKSHWQQVQYAQINQHKRVRIMNEGVVDTQIAAITDRLEVGPRTKSEYDLLSGSRVEIELLIPGLCTIEARIPVQCTIKTVKKCLVRHANQNLLLFGEEPAEVAKSWLVLAQFGSDDMYDVPLEAEAVELKVQLKRMKSMFGLTYEWKDGEPWINWTNRCRFALVIFSVIKLPQNRSLNLSGDYEMMDKDQDDMYSMTDDDEADDFMDSRPDQIPWTFEHTERHGAPATLLENTLRTTHLRAWDFITGQPLASKEPIVFSFAEDPRDKRAFMMVSRSANEPQRFNAPGEGDILGMGANAIVHRVQLRSTRADGEHRDEGWTKVNVGLSSPKKGDKENVNVEHLQPTEWDAAVKRPFSLAKMLGKYNRLNWAISPWHLLKSYKLNFLYIAFLQSSQEAGLAKRLRLANLLNSDKRVLYFYGLGLGLSTNAHNPNQFKFELMLLAEYDEGFSTYTMKQFLEDYMTKASTVQDEQQRLSIQKLQSKFSITSIKVLLVSLLNAFRDLTLMGVQAFDFNHLNNVLVSRDHRSVRLIDIDGNSKGSIEYPVIERSPSFGNEMQSTPHKPSLDVDLNTLLPSIIEQLLLGKGRGRSYVTNTRSEIWRAKDDDAKLMIQNILKENFYGSNQSSGGGTGDEIIHQHTLRAADWFHATLKKHHPWKNWTQDIYDAMRCIDHLPIR